MTRNIHWSRALVLACASFASLLGPIASAAEQQRFTATARDVDSGRVLYTEQYDVQVADNRWVSGTTRYLTPAGKPIAERRFDFSADRYVPVFSLDQTDPAYQEGVARIDRDKVEVYQVRDGERKSASLARTKDLVADCGSQVYVADHIDELQAGKTLHFTLVVAGRVDSFKLRATKVKDHDVEGHHGVQVRIELDSMLSLVLPPIELTIDPATKRVLEYRGITTVKNPATQKSYVARIVFSYP